MWIEILAIVFAVAIVAGVVVSAIKRKKKGCIGNHRQCNVKSVF